MAVSRDPHSILTQSIRLLGDDKLTMTIKAARVNAGLTQKEAAEKLGISYQTLSKYENNPGQMPVKMVLDMCDLYHINVDSLFLHH